MLCYPVRKIDLLVLDLRNIESRRRPSYILDRGTLSMKLDYSIMYYLSWLPIEVREYHEGHVVVPLTRLSTQQWHRWGQTTAEQCYQMPVVTAKNATYNYIPWDDRNILNHLKSSDFLWMFKPMKCFKCRLTNSVRLLMGYKIHPESTNQRVMQKIVEKMKKSRTAANRTCRPLEVGSPLRLVDVFTRYEKSRIKLTALWIRWQLSVSKNILRSLNAMKE